MHSRSLQKTVFNAGSRVFAREDKEGTTTRAIHTFIFFYVIPAFSPLALT